MLEIPPKLSDQFSTEYWAPSALTFASNTTLTSSSARIESTLR